MTTTTATPDHDREHWLNVQQAAEYLSISPRALRYMYSKNRISYVKLGRAVRFRRRDLDQALIDATRPATKPLSPEQFAAVIGPQAARATGARRSR